MSWHRLLALGLALGAAGCVDEAAERGRPPPIALSVARRELVVALQDDPQLRPAARAQLRDAVTGLGGSQPLAVRARIRAATSGDADAVRRALLGLGVDPARIVIEHAAAAPRLLPRLVLTRTFATATNCGAAIAPAFLGDVSPSLDSLGRCIQQNNLAAMVVDPADLVDPPALAPADAPFLVDGLNARLIQREATLPGVVFQSDSGGSGGSYGGGAPPAGNAAAAPAPASPASPPAAR